MRTASFSANAMVVWKVPPEESQRIGDLMAGSPHVTHCYERPTYEDWPYSHYTMIHAGVTINYAEGVEQVPANLQEVRPTVVLSVPRLFEKSCVCL